MKRVFLQNIFVARPGIVDNNKLAFFSLPGKKKAFFLLSFILNILIAAAQSASPATLNTTGNSVIFGNYQFEWSVGEASAVTTMTNGNLQVTSGILQPFVVDKPAPVVTVKNWLAEEIKVYPNPTRDILEINMLHKLAGKSKMELLDLQGKKVMEKIFHYNGTGSIEKWDLSKLAAGQYFLHIQLFDRITGKTIKNGAFKILKIQ